MTLRELALAAGVGLTLALQSSMAAEIATPQDAPQPLSPAESAKQFHLPDGFRLDLIAAEPLIHEPSGVCWDERGRLFVCELHGYNLEGQFDIDALNKTGELDRVVRRVQADEHAKAAAAKETYGTVKLLTDTDGDGRMDHAEIWADRLPPCYGLCPARQGVIVACAPDIVYLADRDGDGKADFRETLFTGFAVGMLERGLNCPQWGPDNWIYVGGGQGGGTITGPHLPAPVPLPTTDFRFKADGTAIEPVTGKTHTLGTTFTEAGDRFVISTNTPGIQVAPIPWRYLARNPDYAARDLTVNAAADNRVYPTSQPHPWRTRRAEDPGFAKYYTDRYGIAESAPNGYFTSACSPLVYQDTALPGLAGQLLACEPAQNLIHRAVITRDGPRLHLSRPAGEAQSEFLSSSDIWFHPISLAIAPDGSVLITDFYREIIEDYSAIPRYLQQQYGLMHGKDHGRLWRLTHRDARAGQPADMSALTSAQLANEVASPHFWRRTTARRLLVERQVDDAAPALVALASTAEQPAAALNALYTLDGLNPLLPDVVLSALASQQPAVRVHALRFAERWLDSEPRVLDRVLGLADDADATVLLQLVLTLGESSDPRVLPTLVRLARQHGNLPWFEPALLSSLSGRSGPFLQLLLREPGQLEHAARLITPVSAAIASRRDPAELSATLVTLAAVKAPAAQLAGLQGIRSRFKTVTTLDLSDDARLAMKKLAAGPNDDLRTAARDLIAILKLESPAERAERIARATAALGNLELPAMQRVAAAEELSAENDAAITALLIDQVAASTPQVREAILTGLFSRTDRLPVLVAALEEKKLPASALSGLQRVALTEHADAGLRTRAIKVLEDTSPVDNALFDRYAAALKGERSLARGEAVFREKCGICHQAHGLGVAVGPDLSAEFQRAEETLLQDILLPSRSITAGYPTYVVITKDGLSLTGVLATDSAGGITLKQPQGKTQTVLTKDIEELRSSAVSLMPDDLTKTVSPEDVAHILAWLRAPTSRAVLIDENPAIAASLNEGNGTAVFVAGDAQSGQLALKVTPLQRHSPRIPGWEFRIREKPGPGEYRFLRFAWKSLGSRGLLIELANHGQWPDAGSPRFRYVAGANTTGWQATRVADEAPTEWTIVTRDLWQDVGDCTLTGIAPTTMDGPALFDQIELLQQP